MCGFFQSVCLFHFTNNFHLGHLGTVDAMLHPIVPFISGQGYQRSLVYSQLFGDPCL